MTIAPVVQKVRDPSSPGRSASRRGYIDWLRGLAILIMIEVHVLDSWTRPTDRGTVAFGYGKVIGGFAAPLFLFLAGVAVVLATRARFSKIGAGRTATLARDWWAASTAVQRRGWQIFALAFVFRFQAYVLNPAALPAGMLRVDILNIMGPAIALAAMLCGLAAARRTRLVTFALASAVMTLATPVVWATSALAFLPDPVEAYFRLLPNNWSFTLFPWAGFVFAGALVGTLLDRPRTPDEDLRFHGWLAAAGIGAAFASYYAWYLPSPYAHTDFWSTSPAFFFMRIGILVAVVGLVYFPQSMPPLTALGRMQPMRRFGRSSLFVYWVHVEIVYGVLTQHLQHKLSVGAALRGFVLFSLMMFALVVVKDALKAWWKGRRQAAKATAVRVEAV